MKPLVLAFFCMAALILGGIAMAGPPSRSPLVELPSGKAAARSGDCSYASGAWTKIDCSDSVAATSAALNEWSRYVIQCGVDSYVRWGTASTTAAVATDGFAPAKAWATFVTTDTVKYVSCLNIGSDSDCRIIECL
jgi:hypothetical protein